jgi:MFS family permease
MIGYEQILAALAVLVLLVGKNQPVFWVCFASQAVSALAGTFFWSFSSSAWANMLEGSRRPRMLAGCYALMRVGLFLSGFVAAYLYDQVSPEALLILVLALRLVNTVLLRRVSAVLSPMIERDGNIHWTPMKKVKISGRQSAIG